MNAEEVQAVWGQLSGIPSSSVVLVFSPGVVDGVTRLWPEEVERITGAGEMTVFLSDIAQQLWQCPDARLVTLNRQARSGREELTLGRPHLTDGQLADLAWVGLDERVRSLCRSPDVLRCLTTHRTRLLTGLLGHDGKVTLDPSRGPDILSRLGDRPASTAW